MTTENPIGNEIYQTTEEHPDVLDAEIEGKIPNWVEGTLLRVGPGKFEWGDTKYNHWFDGDAILNRFAIKDGSVKFSSRFLRSKSYKESEKNNRIVLAQFGTTPPPDPCKNIFSRFFSYFQMPEMTDNCNVNIVKVKGGHYASTEAPKLWKFDKDTLETLDPIDFGKRISGPRSWLAHPHYDEDGTYYNVSTSYMKNRNEIYKVPAKQDLETATDESAEMISSFPCSKGPAYYHSFGMTENYFIFMESSLFFTNPLGLFFMRLMDWAYVDFFKFNENIKSRLHLIERKSGKPFAIFNVNPFMCFHQINAYETDTEVVLDMSGYSDGSVMKALYLSELREDAETKIKPAELRRYHLSLAKADSGKPKQVELEKDAEGKDYEVLHVGFELPRINYDYNGRDYSYAYGMGSSSKPPGLLILHKVNVKTKEVKSWECENCHPSEPVFVPSPNASKEDDGVVLSSVLGIRGQKSFLLVLDACDMTEIARAYVPVRLVPLVHGEFL
eukprot:gene9143-16806_t